MSSFVIQLPFFIIPFIRDKDQDKHSINCAANNSCMAPNPTGLSTTSKKNGWQYVVYYHGGERGDKLKDSWAGAEYALIPK